MICFRYIFLSFFEIKIPNIAHQYQVKDSSKVIKIQKFNLNLDRCTEDFDTHFIYHLRILFERWPRIKRICDLYCISWSPFIFTFLNKTCALFNLKLHLFSFKISPFPFQNWYESGGLYFRWPTSGNILLQEII